METVAELEAKLAEPSEALIRDMTRIDGDVMLLGAGGKMGPSMAKLIVNAVNAANGSNKVIAVSRFSSDGLRHDLESAGVHTIAADLMNDDELQRLPDVKNVIYMAGTKFGTSGNEHFTWAMNAYLPGRVAQKYRKSRIVVFSTGNVYPFTSVLSGGATEETEPSPVGEYGQSCLGRERIFEHFSYKNNTPITIFRLNYAIDMRYGVLLEIAKAVQEGRPIDVTMGNVNVIWQGDANEMAVRALTVCNTPPCVVNITGPETVSLRWAAEHFGGLLNKTPIITGQEQSTALLSNATKAHMLFGYPKVSVRQMMKWIAEWVSIGGLEWNKPTHFQEREGKF
ncbi:NAD-dependent epimerase/dehydratase family protein [Alicyclobacillus dauci]|uniref:NAD(P)-dependent oxidoreductase n=1 Tax=Alicyclobacillus dauci TaxID=1475485 RepID=A0ABY6Z2M2_9BACL|nr:NAD(P)-dependent oxidoreductase [Alicyclobacillus dauci]WAH37125.1 NAD(P)-dependent oxidoreductase [Alicyclobacillus dauci]